MRAPTARLVALLVGSFAAPAIAIAWSPVPVSEDPLVRAPGSQPADGVALEAPNRCLNCHADYNTRVEPGHGWRGSMMAQASRDFLFFAALTVAAQDSVWAVGTPNATDICLRCHMPAGWLAGRSDPTNAAGFTGSDLDGVHCDVCHRMWDPFFADVFQGPPDPVGWDETNLSETPSQLAAEATFGEDLDQSALIRFFDGTPAYDEGRPVEPGYQGAGAGQYYASTSAAKRASFADAEARHQMLYSRFHKQKELCASCHDVSNPVLANLAFAGASPGPGAPRLPTETQAAWSYFHIERTSSEHALSAYGQPGGAPGIGPFAPDRFETSRPDNHISRCQDCHMRDVVGQGADKRGVPLRPDESVEHPESGLPLHDLTGGNVWVPRVLASVADGSPVYDATNADLLMQGPAALTLDLTQGQPLDPDALLDAADRAHQQLSLAASITDASYDPQTGALGFRVQNQTGHKLISGFPEGRRMWLNVRAWAGGQLLWEINPYDEAASTLKGLEHPDYLDPSAPPLPAPEPLALHEVHEDRLIYEMESASSLTAEARSFHVALADGRYKDNRIPPLGFRVDEAATRLCVPVRDGQDAPDLYTADEYAGGYDDVALTLPAGADLVEIGLYYQTTSREYVAFLRDEIKGTAQTLSSPTPSGEPLAYIAQTDPFFAGLAAWGDTVWALWKHNRSLPGAAPVLMTSTTIGGPTTPCQAPTPNLLSATAGHKEVNLAWSDEHSVDPQVVEYRVYYDQAGKAQLVADLPLTTNFTDTGLSDGQTYCYQVTSLHATCESAFSNIVCATPEPSASGTVAGTSTLITGRYVTVGKGRNKSVVFEPATLFSQGDDVVLRALVVDAAGLPLEGIAVTLSVSGPEVHLITTGVSDPAGLAEVSWQTESPNRKGEGGTATGDYQVETAGVSGGGAVWDGVATRAHFTLE